MKASLGPDNILLRGSSLRNTEWVIGTIVYAGHDTKVMMNSAGSQHKLSGVEKVTNKQIVLILLIQLVLCIFASTYATIWTFKNDSPYL